MEPEQFLEDLSAFAQSEGGVQKLRDLILQLAVQGKLVPQDPSDEPASVLLERIAAEKARLVAEKKIRKPKVLPPIEADEVPFAVPEGWEWCRLGNVAKLRRGFDLPKRKRIEGGIPVYGANGSLGTHNEVGVQGPVSSPAEAGALARYITSAVTTGR